MAKKGKKAKGDGLKVVSVQYAKKVLKRKHGYFVISKTGKKKSLGFSRLKTPAARKAWKKVNSATFAKLLSKKHLVIKAGKGDFLLVRPGKGYTKHKRPRPVWLIKLAKAKAGKHKKGHKKVKTGKKAKSIAKKYK